MVYGIEHNALQLAVGAGTLFVSVHYQSSEMYFKRMAHFLGDIWAERYETVDSAHVDISVGGFQT